jgi:hypothetical protein
MSEVVWNCAACGFAIADGDGWVQVRMGEVMKYEDELAAWSAKHDDDGGVGMSDLASHPEPVPWHALHAVCDSTGGEPYAFGVEELRTAWDLVKVTSHIMEKTWLPSTNWEAVLDRKHTEATGNG